VRAMRTFGQQNEDAKGGAHNKDTSAENQDAKDQSVAARSGVASQIPTVDVDGRFTYQSDSNIDSPYTANIGQSSEYDSRANTRGGNTPTSTVATNQEDIFILVRDTPTSEMTGLESMSTCRNGTSGRRVNYTVSGVETGSQMTTMTNEARSSSMMNDECSRTSSPMAYGFMRSSPSATTMSSNMALQQCQQYPADRSQQQDASLQDCDDQNRRTSFKRPQSLSASENRNSSSSFMNTQENRPILGGRPNDNNNDGNNNNNYLNTKFMKPRSAESMPKPTPAPVIWTGARRLPSGSFRQQQQLAEQGEPDADTNNNDNNNDGDGQLIISRL
jgi:hypothetical protein